MGTKKADEPWGETRMPPSTCTVCLHTVDGAGGPPELPSPGDFAVCIRCAGLNIYADDLTLRAPRNDEILAAAEDPDVQKVREIIRHMHKHLTRMN